MIAILSRAVMALAAHCLAGQRREWALAMQAEFEAAADDGKPLTFALGCLAAAWRELPAHAEGRFVIAAYFLALVVIVPAAAVLIATVVAGFPTSYLEHGQALLSDGNHSAVPTLALVVALLAALHLRLAWLAVEHDWSRAAAVGALSAAVTATLLIFTAVVFAAYLAALAQAAVLALELAALSGLARWHSQLPWPAGSKAPLR